jgi:hypothetical protein
MNRSRCQQRTINAKLRGHYGYFGRVGNRGRLWELLYWSTRAWRQWLEPSVTAWPQLDRHEATATQLRGNAPGLPDRSSDLPIFL